MDPRTNPYAPGAGSPPPELAGRDDALEAAAVAVDRVKARRSEKSVLLTGLRGVGKTVLLNRIADEAEARGVVGVRFEAPEGRALPVVLAPQLRRALLALDRGEAAKDRMRRAWSGLAGFIAAARVKSGEIELRIDARPEPGLADTGDLETDLTNLLRVIGEAAARRNNALVLFIDELQYVVNGDLAALIAALHGCQQRRLPVALVGAGLPQLAGKVGKAKSYAERLFAFMEIGELDRPAAERALRAPAEEEGVRFDDDALERILRDTGRYPYFLQEWGAHAWRIADASPISGKDAEKASREARAALDAGFFRVRYERCTPRERRYLAAMARLGPGPHRSGDVADAMGREVTSIAPIRRQLILKGMIYSPAHGDTAFTVPMFDRFLKRTPPDGDP